MNIKLDSIVILALLVLAIFAIIAIIVWIMKTEKRLQKFFVGKKAKDLEDTMVALEEHIALLQLAKEKIEKEITVINHKLKKSIRGVETIRFNPFPDQGSNQSFAIGIQNEEGDGVVLSSLYSRDRMSVFAKPIKGGLSTYELSTEEKEAIQKSHVQ
jgi:hypothetical protein